MKLSSVSEVSIWSDSCFDQFDIGVIVQRYSSILYIFFNSRYFNLRFILKPGKSNYYYLLIKCSNVTNLLKKLELKWKKERIGRSTHLSNEKILRIYRNIYMVARESCSNSFFASSLWVFGDHYIYITYIRIHVCVLMTMMTRLINSI